MHKQTHSRRELGRLLGCTTLLILTGCATSPVPVPELRSAKAIKAGGGIAQFSLSLLNMPYVWGGNDPGSGFDCSGLVSHVYLQAAGMKLPRSAASIAKAARAVKTEEMLPGDLLFFNTLGSPFSHVGIHVGDGKFVHASNPRTGVRVDRLQNSYYASRFEGAKTLLE